MKTDQQIAVPEQTSLPSLEDLITRRWAEANIAGGAVGFTVGTNSSGLYIDDTPGVGSAGRNTSGLYVEDA